MAGLQPPSHCILSWQRPGGLRSFPLLIRALIPLCGYTLMPTFNLYYLLKAPPTITLGIRALMYPTWFTECRRGLLPSWREVATPLPAESVAWKGLIHVSRHWEGDLLPGRPRAGTRVNTPRSLSPLWHPGPRTGEVLDTNGSLPPPRFISIHKSY